MFKDTKEELERIQQELLEEQATQRFEPIRGEQEKPEIDGLLEDEELLREAMEAPKRSVVYKNYSNNYGKDIRNFANGYGSHRQAPEDEPKAAEEAEEMGQTRTDSGLRGPVITAGILLGGILLVLLWWIVQYGGLL